MCVIIFQHDKKKKSLQRKQGRDYEYDDDDDDDDDGSAVDINGYYNHTAGCVRLAVLSVPFCSLMAGKCE